jgi:uncharacterized protein (TIGR03435 family)
MVIDETGLTGSYDVDLEWTPQGVARNPAPPDPSAPLVPAPRPDPNGASLETAIREQLGLQLEADRAPVPVVVVERLEPPGPD